MNPLIAILERACYVDLAVRITRRDSENCVTHHKAVPIRYVTGQSPVYINIDEEDINKEPWKNWSEEL